MKTVIGNYTKSKQKFSSKLVPSMEILALSQHELESLVDASLMDNPFSDVDQNTISLKTRDVDLDFKRDRKKQGELQEIAYADESQMICSSMSSCSLYPHIRQKKMKRIFTVLLESLIPEDFLQKHRMILCRFLNIKKARLLQFACPPQHVDPKDWAQRIPENAYAFSYRKSKAPLLAQHIVCSHLEALSTGDFLKIAEVGAYRCGARKAGVVADQFTESNSQTV